MISPDQSQMMEAFFAAVVLKVCDGSIEITADDLLAVEGKTFAMSDTPEGFTVTVSDE